MRFRGHLSPNNLGSILHRLTIRINPFAPRKCQAPRLPRRLKLRKSLECIFNIRQFRLPYIVDFKFCWLEGHGQCPCWRLFITWHVYIHVQTNTLCANVSRFIVHLVYLACLCEACADKSIKNTQLISSPFLLGASCPVLNRDKRPWWDCIAR